MRIVDGIFTCFNSSTSLDLNYVSYDCYTLDFNDTLVDSPVVSFNVLMIFCKVECLSDNCSIRFTSVITWFTSVMSSLFGLLDEHSFRIE